MLKDTKRRLKESRKIKIMVFYNLMEESKYWKAEPNFSKMLYTMNLSGLNFLNEV